MAVLPTIGELQPAALTKRHAMANGTGSTISRYIGMVQSFPRLSLEEEQACASAWADRGDREAAEKLVRANLRSVVAIASKYRGYGIPLSELIAEGNVGVVQALKRFQPNRGNRFVTYASYWIRSYVMNYVIRSWSLVSTQSGAMRSKTFFRLRRERGRLLNILGDTEAANEHLATTLGLRPDQVQSMLHRMDDRDVSLDAKVSDDSTTAIIDTLVVPAQDQEQSFESHSLADWLHDAVPGALEELDSRERLIVVRRLLADPEDELSLAELGRLFGISRERARQLERRAKMKLKRSLERRSSIEGADWFSSVA